MAQEQRKVSQQELSSPKPSELSELKEAIYFFSFREDRKNLFTLASGKKSPYYFDLKQTLLQPRYLKLAANLMLQQITHHCPQAKAVGGLTMGADPLTYAITMTQYQQQGGANLLPLIIRKQAKNHGNPKRVEGFLKNLHPGDTVALLEDVITTGQSALLAYQALQELGFVVTHCFALLDRKEGGQQALKEQGIQLHALFTIDDFRRPI